MSVKTLFIRQMSYTKASSKLGMHLLKGLVHIAEKVHKWNRYHRSLHDLAKLDDRMLADIGISRAQVEEELRKSLLAKIK